MPRHTHLLRRGSRYYLNVKIPLDLREAFGKELIRKALDTSDPHEAARRVRFESFKLDSLFEEKRTALRAAKMPLEKPFKPPEISEREAHQIVVRFFSGLEKISDEWLQEKGGELPASERAETLDTLRIDERVYDGGNERFLPSDGSFELDNFLRAEGLEWPKDSPAYQKLRPLFRRARLENTRRDMERISGLPLATTREPLLREVFSHTPTPPSRPIVTLGEMLNRFTKALTDAKRTEGTHRTYEIPCRLLREFFGENASLEMITRERIEGLFGLLRRAPSNATKRYPQLTLEQAVAEADKTGDEKRLRGKTLANYFNNIVAIFNFAVVKKLMAENPASDRYLRASFPEDGDERAKVHFTVEELNRLFRAPLYTGCRDDQNNYSKPGPEKPRRGRFWVPLLSLFHGLRCNETAQLYTEDVCEEDGVPFLEIREERANGSKCDKRLKSKQSKRRVPIHAEILKLGFLNFVETRRTDSLRPRLFPDLPLAASGYYSDGFSKWFARFVEAELGEGCAATFHSFRHQFRDALSEAEVPIPDVERLGGWEIMARSAERHYGKGPSLRHLRAQIDRVSFPKLDLRHLYSE